MSAATADKPKATGRKKGAAESNGSGTVEEAHAALGTDVQSDPGPQQVHDGDPDETGDEVPLPGLQLSFAVGGKRPTTSGLRLVGGKLDIEQVFSKGQTIELRIEAEIREVSFIDQVDAATGQVIGSERRHKAHIVGVSVL
jgi:hypothetical protein